MYLSCDLLERFLAGICGHAYLPGMPGHAKAKCWFQLRMIIA